MRVILDGNDVTARFGEARTFEGKMYVPLAFLKAVQKVSIEQTETEIHITTPENLTDLDFKISREKDGRMKAKAELSVGNTKTSVDHEGRVETDINFKF